MKHYLMGNKCYLKYFASKYFVYWELQAYEYLFITYIWSKVDVFFCYSVYNKIKQPNERVIYSKGWSFSLVINILRVIYSKWVTYSRGWSFHARMVAMNKHFENVKKYLLNNWENQWILVYIGHIFFHGNYLCKYSFHRHHKNHHLNHPYCMHMLKSIRIYNCTCTIWHIRFSHFSNQHYFKPFVAIENFFPYIFLVNQQTTTSWISNFVVTML